MSPEVSCAKNPCEGCPAALNLAQAVVAELVPVVETAYGTRRITGDILARRQHNEAALTAAGVTAEPLQNAIAAEHENMAKIISVGATVMHRIDAQKCTPHQLIEIRS